MFNKDTKRRAEVLGIPDDYPSGGIRKFKNATVEQIKTLIDENFLDPSDRQNFSPTAGKSKYTKEVSNMVTEKEYVFRVWVGKKETKRCVFINACNGVAARIIAKQKYPGESIGAVWRTEI